MGIITYISGLLGLNKLLTSAIAVALLIGAIWGVYELIKYQGAQEVRDQIEKENSHAIDKGSTAIRSFDECVAADRVWDFSANRCTSTAVSPGK